MIGELLEAHSRNYVQDGLEWCNECSSLNLFKNPKQQPVKKPNQTVGLFILNWLKSYGVSLWEIPQPVNFGLDFRKIQ
jgi:hypothetical protein